MASEHVDYEDDFAETVPVDPEGEDRSHNILIHAHTGREK